MKKSVNPQAIEITRRFFQALSAISLDIQANKKNVHEKVHETTPKVTFPGSLFLCE